MIRLMVTMEIDEVFEKAAAHAGSFTNILEKEMLTLYGLYKQAKLGPCNTLKPYVWDFTAKAKWESWNDVKKLSEIEAKQKYIEFVKDLDPVWDEYIFMSSPEKPSLGLGVSVSVLMQDPEEEINECDKTPFDWCKEGKLEKLKCLITNDNSIVDSADEDNLTLLHWSADHGYLDITRYLLNAGCNINSQDSELQTPLHYAVTCDHIDLVKLLLNTGADQQLKDIDGHPAFFYCESDSMKSLFTFS